ncbi:unnamed protein product [Adineta steineri]|uniref:N-acetyltransferase domain-containing protein n=1 Tax=Adineta steineri TaxID=433720 RepID=A0A819DYG9_9BILA|nr:unnamed protein product [Adineta steineri]
MANDEYTYEVIDNERDARLCAQLIAEQFTNRHPITVFDCITTNSFFDQYSWPLLANVLDERLSFLARHRPSGEIIGAVVAGDLYLFQKKYPYDLSHPAKAIAISDLYDELDDIFIRRDFNQELKPNMVLQIPIIAVRSEHSGNGVASQLHAIMFDRARDTKGFQYAFVRATNPIIRHIYVNKMDGRELTRVDPTTWRWKKKADRLLYPYNAYRDEFIANILIKLIAEQDMSTV